MWKYQKVAVIRTNSALGTTETVGFVAKRHCGCEGQEGYRLDTNEPTFSIVPCDDHGAHAARAHETLANMPPQNRAVSTLFAEQLDVEIGEGR